MMTNATPTACSSQPHAALAVTAMGTMAWINLVAILLLSPLAFLLLRDYTSKLKMGKDPVFKLSEHPGLKRKIKSDIW